jgi:TMEM175 potassium channel family protein
MDRSRLEAFSDGVIAVAITLLALDLTVAGPGHGKLADQLSEHWPAFLAYVISFFTIGIIWVNHHALIRTIKTVTRTLLFLNLLLLLFVVVIPFATSTVADYLSENNGDARVATALYGASFVGMSIAFSAIFEWTLHGQRVYQPLPPEQHWAARARFSSGGLVYVAATIVALFNAIVAFVIIGLVAVYYIFERTPRNADGGGDDDDDDESTLPRYIVAIKQVSRARLG